MTSHPAWLISYSAGTDEAADGKAHQMATLRLPQLQLSPWAS